MNKFILSVRVGYMLTLMANKKQTYYFRHRETVCLNARNAYKAQRELINRAKSRSCMDCGIQYNPWVMHFDHRNPAEKVFTIGCGGSLNAARLTAEMAKCDVVCANCHAERTHKQVKPWIEKRRIQS